MKCFAIWGSIQECCGSVFCCIDRLAVRLNRVHPKWRRTAAGVAICALPLFLCCFPLIAGSKMSTAAVALTSIGGAVGSSLVFGCLWKQYSWLMRPANWPNWSPIPPLRIRNLLAKELERDNLPEEYKGETDELLRGWERKMHKQSVLLVEVSSTSDSPA